MIDMTFHDPTPDRAPSPGWLTREEMIEVDRVMIDELGIGLMQMMENAGRNLAQLAIERYRPTSVSVCVGSGGNGGGGMVAARHLANRGVDVTVVPARSGDELSGVPKHQFDVLTRMELAVGDFVRQADLLIDAVIGYSLRGAPTGRSAELIAAMNSAGAPVLALDIPSGVDATTGETPGEHVNAEATLTLAAPKFGLNSTPGVGELFVADISVPPAVLARLGHPAPDFSSSPIVRVA